MPCNSTPNKDQVISASCAARPRQEKSAWLPLQQSVPSASQHVTSNPWPNVGPSQANQKNTSLMEPSSKHHSIYTYGCIRILYVCIYIHCMYTCVHAHIYIYRERDENTAKTWWSLSPHGGLVAYRPKVVGHRRGRSKDDWGLETWQRRSGRSREGDIGGCNMMQRQKTAAKLWKFNVISNVIQMHGDFYRWLTIENDYLPYHYLC